MTGPRGRRSLRSVSRKTRTSRCFSSQANITGGRPAWIPRYRSPLDRARHTAAASSCGEPPNATLGSQVRLREHGAGGLPGGGSRHRPAARLLALLA
jgi:hypothetical protein